jgi:heat shock protein 4
MESLRAVVGPIAQRYFDKEEEKRQALLAKKNEAEQMRKAQDDLLKRQAEQQNKLERGDEEMKDADQKQPTTEQMDLE